MKGKRWFPCAHLLKTIPVTALGTCQPSSALFKAPTFGICMNSDSAADSFDPSPRISNPSKHTQMLIFAINCRQTNTTKGFSIISSMKIKSESSWSVPSIVPNGSSQVRLQGWLFNKVGSTSDDLHLWNLEDSLHWEFVSCGRTVYENMCAEQLEQIHDVLRT